MPDGQYAQACLNLRLYLSQAKLPTMLLEYGSPAIQQSTRTSPHLFTLSPEPDSKRKLKLVLHLLPRVINKRIEMFILKNFPNKPIVGAADHSYERPAHICIPAPSFDIIFATPARMRDMRTMSAWMEMPLLTAERLMYIVWPEQTKGFCLMTSQNTHSNGLDDPLYKAYYWKKCRGIDQDDITQSTCKVIIAALAPWALSPIDMDDFMRIDQFPAFSVEQGVVNGPSKYNRAQKVWAKIWDDCTCKSCPYFVVSVYHGWVFGVFIKGWTTALISEVIRHTDEEPTVLQWLVFWIASSMGLSSWKPPVLRRFDNPDIRDLASVCEKPSFTGTEKQKAAAGLVAQNEWFDRNIRVERGDKLARTYEFEGLANTWYTSYDQ
ncbi:hypothetical protein K439DRAFT_1658990 [Ramaria rubella]|nr:hypothetical protein K439DRAFT_1658990 [Ramaria rubella]